MTLSPESNLSRVLAVLLLAVLLAGAWYLIVAPVWLGFNERLDARARLSQLLSDYKARIEPVDPLRRQLAAIEGMTASTTTGYLPNGNMAAVTSALQTTVRQHLDKSQGRLRSMQILPPARTEGAEKFAVRVDFAMSDDRLLAFLYGFEAADPYLFLENLEIRSGETPERTAENRQVQLNMRMDVVGYTRAQAGP